MQAYSIIFTRPIQYLPTHFVPLSIRIKKLSSVLTTQSKKAILRDVSTDVILKDLNTCIEKMGARHTLRAIKRLPSGDFAVSTVNNKEAEKLRSNTQWAKALRSNARVVTRIYEIMINGVRVANFDMSNRDQAIEHIKASNTDIEDLQGIDIKWIGWRNAPKPGQELASLVIEFSTPEHANAALDYHILIGQEVYAGVVFNRACKPMQCFRCYSYRHITVQCTNKEACGYCSGKYSSKDCPGNSPSRCTLCKGNHCVQTVQPRTKTYSTKPIWTSHLLFHLNKSNQKRTKTPTTDRLDFRLRATCQFLGFHPKNAHAQNLDLPPKLYKTAGHHPKKALHYTTTIQKRQHQPLLHKLNGYLWAPKTQTQLPQDLWDLQTPHR